VRNPEKIHENTAEAFAGNDPQKSGRSQDGHEKTEQKSISGEPGYEPCVRHQSDKAIIKNRQIAGVLSPRVVILLLLLPFMILFLIPAIALLESMWLWMVLLICIWMIWFLIANLTSAIRDKTHVESGLRMLQESEQPQIIRNAMNVRIATEEAGIQVFRGRLLEPATTVFEKLKQAYPEQMIPLIQEDEKLGNTIILLPKPVELAALEKPLRPRLHWILFALTIATTTWAGAAHQGIDLMREPARFVAGMPYSLGLLAILGVHELGHYFTARHHGMNVTPPFFIPVPFALGTFGAFIKMRSPAETRQALFDVAVAGPLAGLVMAIPALFIGLRSSTLLPFNEDSAMQTFGGTSVGSSLLFSIIARLSFGDALQFDHLVQLSPLAFAGWLGLIITALNLLPIGQLDGGHIVYAMFGQRIGGAISGIAMWSLFLLALFVWQTLMMWAVIVFIIASRGSPPLNDVTPITPRRRRIGYATFAILTSILIPFPQALREIAGFQ
jgi:Zn-dependent protease